MNNRDVRNQVLREFAVFLAKDQQVREFKKVPQFHTHQDVTFYEYGIVEEIVTVGFCTNAILLSSDPIEKLTGKDPHVLDRVIVFQYNTKDYRAVIYSLLQGHGITMDMYSKSVRAAYKKINDAITSVRTSELRAQMIL